MALITTPTLQKLIGRIRGLLNQPDRLNSFWSDDDLTAYIEDGISLCFLELTHINEGYFVTTADLDLVANTETVALPVGCFEIRSLYRKVSDGYEIMDYRNRVDEGYSTDSAGGGSSYVPDYFLRDNSIVLRPIPGFSETGGLKLEYVQLPDTMLFGGDSMTSHISPVFRQVVEMFAVYKAKLKESLVTGAATHRFAEENFGAVFKSFKDTAQLRSKGPSYVKPFNP
jgi:hypothetical protein